MKKIVIINVLIVLVFLSGCATQEGLFYAAPSLLPDTTPQMKTAGFWISRHSDPDKIILNEEEIKAFNQHVEELKLNKSIFAIDKEVSSEELKKTLSKSLNDFSRAGYYLSDGRTAPQGFFETIKENMNLSSVPSNLAIAYGLIVTLTDQRILPTQSALNAKRYDIDFDELQNSALDMATAVAILHESADGQWLYVASQFSDGWIKKENVAIESKAEIQKYLATPKKGVVVIPKADLYIDEDLKHYYDFVLMGTELPIYTEYDERIIAVQVPHRKENGDLETYVLYMKQNDLHAGYLPFSARQIIEQAFLMLNAPYGWGGMYGEQDCSKFLQEVFKTVGISLPRNSSAQAKVSGGLSHFPQEMDPDIKIEMLQNHGLPGVSILPMKGHIMVYLGIFDGRPYAIHAPWAYRENDGGKDRIRVINRVAVTSLDLGKGSQKGSLLERMNGIVNFSK